MLCKFLLLCFLLTILLSISIHAYRLDSFSQLDDVDEENELNDPFLIKRLQELLAKAAASKRGDLGLDGYAAYDHLLNRRLSVNRRPGLLRLK